MNAREINSLITQTAVNLSGDLRAVATAASEGKSLNAPMVMVHARVHRLTWLVEQWDMLPLSEIDAISRMPEAAQSISTAAE